MDSGVVVLHTSPASGSQRVCDAVKQFVWPDEGSRWRFEIVSGIPSENEWHARITATFDQMDTEFALLWVDESAPHSMGSICECIRSAENLLGQQHDTKRVLRIVFSLGPHGTWSYLKGLGDKESHVSVVRAARWRPEAVGIWLMRRNMPVLDQGFLSVSHGRLEGVYGASISSMRLSGVDTGVTLTIRLPNPHSPIWRKHSNRTAWTRSLRRL